MVEYFKKKHSEIEKSYIILLASAYNAKGLSNSQIAVDVISSDDIPDKMKQYIDDIQTFSDELKDEIINALRELFDT